MTTRCTITFRSTPGLHLHAPHDEGLCKYWPHEQEFLLKILRYFEGNEDSREGIPIPDKFWEGEYLEGIGKGTQVSLRLPVIKNLLARASRTWPGTIFSIFNGPEHQELIQTTPILWKDNGLRYR